MKLNKLFGKHTKKVINIIIIVAVIVLAGILFNYNRNKGLLNESLDNNELQQLPKEESNVNKDPSKLPNKVNNTGPNPMLQDDTAYLKVSGISSTKPVNTCTNQPMMDPKELLPTDNNNEWSNIMPNNDLKNVHMLNAGHHVGINTVGSSLRNANLQIRSEPVIPQQNLGPWNNTTIEPDNLRRPLEIGKGE